MATIGENALSAVIPESAGLRLVEPGIYSVLSDSDGPSPYDTAFGAIYDHIACNRLYNRLIWGYSVSILASIAQDALHSTDKGTVLDLGCGSLAFTAKTYMRFSERPVVLVDRSLNMLRIARSRLIRMNGGVPDNLAFLHADALRLPFFEKSFSTIISENLLHCLEDTKILLAGLKKILAEDGRIYFTTLIRAGRLADRYLEALAGSGKLVSRNLADHQAVFDQLGMSITCRINGNMAAIFCGGE